MTTHWVGNMTDACHLTEELWHWAILLNFLCQNSLHAKSLMCCHYKKEDQNRFSIGKFDVVFSLVYMINQCEAGMRYLGKSHCKFDGICVALR